MASCVWRQVEAEAGTTALPSVRADARWCWEGRAARPVNIFHRPVAVSEVAEVAVCLGAAAEATEVSPMLPNYVGEKNLSKK